MTWEPRTLSQRPLAMRLDIIWGGRHTKHEDVELRIIEGRRRHAADRPVRVVRRSDCRRGSRLHWRSSSPHLGAGGLAAALAEERDAHFGQCELKFLGHVSAPFIFDST